MAKKAAAKRPSPAKANAKPKARPAAKDWPFEDKPNTAVISLKRVVFDGRPVLGVLHDASDGMWQFIDKGRLTEAYAAVVALDEMIELDPTLVQVAALPPGWGAWRKRVGGAWTVRPR